MKRALLILVNLVLWPISLIFFVVVVPIVAVCLILFGPIRVEFLVRWMCRMIARLGGAYVVTEFAEPIDTGKVRLFVANHVNLFDPFVICGVTPQLARGIELESHFKIPIYGFLMRNVGNVPVPDERTPGGLKRTYRLTREAMDRGISFCMFPEGSRTRDGRVGPFETGAFRMARHLDVPITPVSVSGAYRWFRTGGWLFRPGRIVIRFHESIDVRALSREEQAALPDRVHAIIAGSVAEHHA